MPARPLMLAPDGRIGVDVLLQHLPRPVRRVPAGDRELVVNRRFALKVAGIPGIARCAHTHHPCEGGRGCRSKPAPYLA